MRSQSPLAGISDAKQNGARLLPPLARLGCNAGVGIGIDHPSKIHIVGECIKSCHWLTTRRLLLRR